MALEYRTRDGDTVDLIAFKVYGNTAGGIVERVLDANPGVADRGPVLPGGLILTLPAIETATTAVAEGVKLWD